VLVHVFFLITFSTDARKALQLLVFQ